MHAGQPRQTVVVGTPAIPSQLRLLAAVYMHQAGDNETKFVTLLPSVQQAVILYDLLCYARLLQHG